MPTAEQCVPCTFAGCNLFFVSQQALRDHKVREPDHYYCQKCDLDCLDWVDLTQHKVDEMAPFLEGNKGSSGETPQHITCEFCGVDFKSFGGREIHRQRMHRASQNVFCPGCDHMFVRAASMLAHLENNECAKISSDQFRRAIQMKHIIKEILKDSRMPENMRRLGAPSTTEAGNTSICTTNDDDSDDSDDGRVSLLEAQSGRSQRAPNPAGVQKSSNISLSASESHQLTNKLSTLSISSGSDKSGDTLFGGHKEKQGVRETKKSTSTSKSIWHNKGTSKALFPDAKPTPPTAAALTVIEQSQQMAGASQNLFEHNVCDTRSRDWDPKRFYDPIVDRYYCPFQACASLVFATVEKIEQHFVYGHTKYHFTCDMCLKVFDMPSKLIGHVESTDKCNIRNTSKFQELVNDVSGGYLKVKPVKQPKIFRSSTAVVKAGHVVDGVMDSEFKGVMPLGRREPKW